MRPLHERNSGARKRAVSTLMILPQRRARSSASTRLAFSRRSSVRGAGACSQPPGSRLLFKALRKGGPHHVVENEETHSIIPEVLDQAVAEGIVCVQIARFI